MSIELKPCPFCSGEAYLVPSSPHVYCQNHMCAGSAASSYGSASEAIRGWNTRHEAAKAPGQPDELQMTAEQCDTFYCHIFIAGDLSIIKQVCRENCLKIGLCVTVTEASYIYTGGEETGAVIGLINYPRFPEDAHKIILKATALGRLLMERCFQKSFSITMPGKTIRYSREIGR